MNRYHQRQLPEHANDVQDKRSGTLIESRNFLKRLQHSVKQSEEFNKNARGYLVNAKKAILFRSKSVMSVAVGL